MPNSTSTAQPIRRAARNMPNNPGSSMTRSLRMQQSVHLPVFSQR
ncbi:MAG: hypothetical protein AVDCRST_MAG71-637 [uncultured Lysobacter sp.]|uniref:Uncharacterized protein n=1 Tax=uncultured Lysobacter sp. TaxID=271060 RepID=A0A6J4KMK1_9GAMM|nr:MAG: hypothetical protein AVDCRST_MAG71-637 [uncultured Lysobacter sp.]